MRRAPVIHRKLWRDEFGVDGGWQLLIAALLIIAVLIKCADAGKSLEIGEPQRERGIGRWNRPKCLCSNGFEVSKNPGAFAFLDAPRADAVRSCYLTDRRRRD